MPRVVLSGLLQDIRGSMGGSTFSAWKGLTYLRNKAITISNPQTPVQQALRANFAESVGEYRNLTPVQKAMWEEYAQALKATNAKNQVVGDSGIMPVLGKTQSGFNAYIGVNQHLEAIDLPRVAVPPVDPQPLAPDFTIEPVYDAVSGCIDFEFKSQDNPLPALTLKLEAWIKGWWSGSHSYIAGTYVVPAPPAIPDPVEICTIRKGWDDIIQEVPIADLVPCEIFVQCRIVRQDGRVSPQSGLYRVACA